jgi:hypothetical protein
VKETITFFKKQAAAVVEQIENMKQKPSSITMMAGTGEPTASTLSSQSQSRSQSPSPFPSPFLQAASPIFSPLAQSPFGKSLGPGSDSDDDLPASSGLSKAANDVDENKEE